MFQKWDFIKKLSKIFKKNFMFEILVTFFFQDLFCLLEAAFRIRIRIHPDPLHLTGSGSGSTLILASDPVPDPLRFLFPDPDPAKCSGSGWIRVEPKLCREKSKTATTSTNLPSRLHYFFNFFVWNRVNIHYLPT